MAKRELSSTLRNLKFMQRGANKEDKTKKEEEEVVPERNFPSFITTKRCMVVMEGDPTPGAIRGRMSFQSFNPSIDKLNQDFTNLREPEKDATLSGDQVENTSNRDRSTQDGPAGLKEETSNSNNAKGDLKRKQIEVIPDVQFSNKSPKNVQGDQSSSSSKSKKNSHKQPKRENLDWNVLRPPKSQSKRG